MYHSKSPLSGLQGGKYMRLTCRVAESLFRMLLTSMSSCLAQLQKPNAFPYSPPAAAMTCYVMPTHEYA